MASETKLMIGLRYHPEEGYAGRKEKASPILDSSWGCEFLIQIVWADWIRQLLQKTQFPATALETAQVTKSTLWGAHFLPQNREVFASCGGNGTITLFK